MLWLSLFHHYTNTFPAELCELYAGVVAVMCCLQYWMSHGYDYYDRDYDEWAHHMIMLTFVTLPTVFFMLFIFYYPDQQ